MKRPLSPDYLLEHGLASTAAFLRAFEGGFPGGELTDSACERKRVLFSLCEACNLQLNSAAQAQVHFNGKSHLRRVKQLNNGKPAASPAPGTLLTSSTSAGSTCHSAPLPALVRTSTLMMQPSLEIKPFMPYTVDSSSAVGFFPNFNTMDPVQKAVINHTFGVSIPPRKKQVISCNVCQLRFNSDSQAEAHYKGSKHAKKLKALETTKSKQKAGPSKDTERATASSPPPIAANNDAPDDDTMVQTNGSTQPGNMEVAPCVAKPEATLLSITPEAPSVSTNGAASIASESEEEKAKKLLYCSLCKVAVNSLSQLEAHNTGSKHKTMVEARNGAGPIKSYPRSGSRLKLQNGGKGSGLQNKTFHCEICDVHVNSEIQLKQHISSRRHKDRVAGKPMKPKYSPYNKLQRSPGALAAKLAFQKDLIKPMAPAFLSSSLAAAVSSSLSLPPRPATSLFQASAVPSAFLRPGHGPIRATTASILFAPY
ncbi:zinc finger protein 385B isoform X2 [Ambystoma mexicanum]|uniref:zinc finger protein 385B isoform X2 n=1 Tax=Ambystoma mexicanum TaxID=8296 RepID=UPI0037E79576